MNTQEYMKFRERKYAEQFVWQYEEKTGLSIKIVEDDREKPDFGLQVANRRVGLEVTDFFFRETEDGTPHNYQILRTKGVTEAERLFHSGGGPPLYVHPVFKDHPARLGPKDNAEVQKFAVRLSEFVKLNLGAVRNGQTWFENCPWIEDFLWLHELKYCLIRPSIDGEHERWSPVGPATDVVLDYGHIQREVDRKAEKYCSYTRDFEEVWLLSVNHGALLTVPCRISEEARHSAYTFPFDQAFWLDLFPDNVLVRLRRNRPY